MSFRPVFVAVVIAFGLIVAALLINRARPRAETEQPSAQFVRASGKCAECHIHQQYSVVHEYEMSAHAQKGINCLDCHQPAPGQQKTDHHGFVISTRLTAGNCRSCHEPIYQEYLRSRHAATSWAAVYGQEGLRPEQVELSERFQPGGARRPPHPLTQLEGSSSTTSGCAQCHSVGKPNDDGTIGTCTACHTRHTSSVAIARLPTTCGQCHLGPDHSQLEIYEESKHGVMFHAQEKLLKLDTPPRTLSTRASPTGLSIRRAANGRSGCCCWRSEASLAISCSASPTTQSGVAGHRDVRPDAARLQLPSVLGEHVLGTDDVSLLGVGPSAKSFTSYLSYQ